MSCSRGKAKRYFAGKRDNDLAVRRKDIAVMLKTSLQRLIDEKNEIQITYRREKDETVKTYRLEPLEIKEIYVKEDGKYETYLFAIKLPKSIKLKPQKFILSRIISAS